MGGVEGDAMFGGWIRGLFGGTGLRACFGSSGREQLPSKAAVGGYTGDHS